MHAHECKCPAVANYLSCACLCLSARRGVVERAFLAGVLPVLAATTTLALGVNLPARLVMIKGTTVYRGSTAGGALDACLTDLHFCAPDSAAPDVLTTLREYFCENVLSLFL